MRRLHVLAAKPRSAMMSLGHLSLQLRHLLLLFHLLPLYRTQLLKRLLPLFLDFLLNIVGNLLSGPFEEEVLFYGSSFTPAELLGQTQRLHVDGRDLAGRHYISYFISININSRFSFTADGNAICHQTTWSYLLVDASEFLEVTTFSASQAAAIYTNAAAGSKRANSYSRVSNPIVSERESCPFSWSSCCGCGYSAIDSHAKPRERGSDSVSFFSRGRNYCPVLKPYFNWAY
jgi:hypothetical protein